MNALISVTINAEDMKFGRKIAEPHAQLMLIFDNLIRHATPLTLEIPINALTNPFQSKNLNTFIAL